MNKLNCKTLLTIIMLVRNINNLGGKIGLPPINPKKTLIFLFKLKNTKNAMPPFKIWVESILFW